MTARAETNSKRYKSQMSGLLIQDPGDLMMPSRCAAPRRLAQAPDRVGVKTQSAGTRLGPECDVRRQQSNAAS